MCKLVEDYAKEYAEKYAEKYAKEYAEQQSIENAANLLKNGVSVDIIADSIPTLSCDIIISLSEKIPQTTKV